MRNLLGGKGANLAEMNKVGLPVPPGFTVTTEVLYILLQQRPLVSGRPEGSGFAKLWPMFEGIMGKKFADANNPLLFFRSFPAPEFQCRV